MGFDVKQIDELLAGRSTVAEIAGENGLLKQLTKAILERVLAAELTEHLGYEKHTVVGRNSGNSRNGSSKKQLKGDFGALALEVPRDRAGSFEPQLVAKGQTRWHGFDDKILSLYARGMTTREIQGHLEEIYQVEVSPTLISAVTDAVLDEVKAWQSRPLDTVYAIVYLDALVVKMRSEGRVENRAVYVAIGVNMEGCKEVLGLWTSANEGAKFWLQVLTELTNRGVKDIFIACVDGLKGFPQAIETVFPKTTVQLCIVHMVRGSLNFVGWKERKAVAADLKLIYRAATAEEAERQLEECRQVGSPIPLDQRHVEKKLAGDCTVLSVSAGDPQDRLYHQRHREFEHESAQGDQNQRRVSQRGRGPESDVPGPEKPDQEMAIDPGLERCTQLLRAALGRSLPTATKLTKNRTSTGPFTQIAGHTRADGCKPVFDQGDALIIQNKTRQDVEKARFRQQAFHRLSQIYPNSLRRFRDFLDHVFTSFDHRHKIFQIVACLKVQLASSSKGFHFGGEKERSGNHTNRRSSWQAQRGCMAQG